MAGEFNFKPGDVVNGSFGKVYMDGRNIAEILEFTGKLSLEGKDVKLANGETGKKNTSSSLELTIKLQKVFSQELKILENVKDGKLNNYCDLNIQIDDPDAYGAEAIAISNCLFTGDFDILSFQRGELLEREITLSAQPSNIDILESIEDI